ncbi:MAG TPA: aminomethyl-transferring glycine dehydrogenase subunit GcvPA [Candidatus Saccharimonadales bacterium]|nr:aminomethyl-transferring glycine dehydrogenase subunit GcvPA [Candidatus Saccharimonadales bacterium]
MRFFPQGDEDLRAMLDAVGAASVSDLFSSIPAGLRLQGLLDLPPAAGETDLRREFRSLARRNAGAATHAVFLGAGAYNHEIPAAVPQLLGRSEFYTTYTPYQAEISQGTLQTIFEFQSLVCLLTETEVANASLYDGASGLAEAVLMSHRATGRQRVVLAGAIHPNYAAVVRTYTRYLPTEIVTVPASEDGRVDGDALRAALDAPAACVAFQSPNFLGCIEEVASISRAAADNGALAVCAVPEPVSLGMLRGPGGLGADVVVGEAQPFGVPLGYGGPYVGFMGARERLTRQMPGRIAGETVDAEGRRGYVLTLSTREQHIRRERATSNICTNQGLMALAVTIHLSLLGGEGLHELALQNHHRARYAAERLSALRGCRLAHTAPFFNEFVLELPSDPEEINRALLRKGILGGLPLRRAFPGGPEELDRRWLLCITELNSRGEIDRLVEAVEGAL